MEGVRRCCRQGTTKEDVLKAWNTCCIDIPQYRLDKVLQLRQHLYAFEHERCALAGH
ncbi:MAG: hypothetical protein IJ693_09235 [Bacteroidaceae bacterium]|nr:hypothetical protein [Bacteroidaceae bacterium]